MWRGRLAPTGPAWSAECWLGRGGPNDADGTSLTQIERPVSTLRVVVDRDSGQRKGFAFLEYFEPDTAQRAVRDLNGIDFYGRPLRVNIAEQDTKTTNSASATMGNRKRKGGEPWGGAGAPGWGQ